MPSKPRWWSDAETFWKCTASLTPWNCSTPTAQQHTYSFFYLSVQQLALPLVSRSTWERVCSTSWGFWLICPHNIIWTCIMQDAYLSAWAPSVSDSFFWLSSTLNWYFIASSRPLTYGVLRPWPDRREGLSSSSILACPCLPQGLLAKPMQLSSLFSVGAGKNW